ncbi:methyltransferase-like protein 22 isoform X1 [Sapajus apella]|uniref:Methyltransferase-like protein 22 isoform X1 n=1 Tax=Sapajus apella TaxID=9515 RepID=A0A6J3G754_SAPAP|nr:methyltransferase-like protein 22 isoform X1 [Sapajus apella]
MVQLAPAAAMDEVTFRSDTVLSDVHLYTPNHRHLMVRLNSVGQPVFLSQFKLLWSQDSWTDSGAKGGDHRDIHTKEPPSAETSGTGSLPGSGHGNEGFSLQAGADTTGQEVAEAQLDEDGDLDVVRRPRAASDSSPAGPLRDKVHPMILAQEEDNIVGEEAQGSPHDIIRIEHTMATPLEDVGKQVWRGALLLADYILFRQDLFRGCTALELGAGTGFASIIAATMARTVYCTDVGADLLAMCQRNIALNSHLAATGALHPARPEVTHFTGSSLCPDGPPPPSAWSSAPCTACRNECGVVKVKELDWLKDDLCTDPEVPFSWSQEEISDLYNHTTIILAAEVFYDNNLTDAVFKTLSRLAHRLKNACTAILSVEKRLNFTLRHLDVTCEAYDHFRSCLRALEQLRDGNLHFVVEPVEASFPQLLVYERIRQLELWKIVAEPVT